MIQTYYALYGGTGDEVVVELITIESQLSELNESADEMVIILNEIDTTLANGYDLAEETITQLEQTAGEVETAITAAAEQTQAWAAHAQESITLAHENFTPPETDLSSILENSIPTDIADSQEEALTQVAGYINMASEALADNSITPEEMISLAEMGSNATASLTAQGNVGSAIMVSNINNINQQMAKGELQGAVNGLSGLQGQLPDLSGITLPSGNRPARP